MCLGSTTLVVFLILMVFVVFFFFFKQKTAYEIVSRDWSSDVCSSDLRTTLYYLLSNFRCVSNIGWRRYRRKY